MHRLSLSWPLSLNPLDSLDDQDPLLLAAEVALIQHGISPKPGLNASEPAVLFDQPPGQAYDFMGRWVLVAEHSSAYHRPMDKQAILAEIIFRHQGLMPDSRSIQEMGPMAEAVMEDVLEHFDLVPREPLKAHSML